MCNRNGIAKCDTLKQHLGGALPLAFVEHGVLMLSNVDTVYFTPSQ